MDTPALPTPPESKPSAAPLLPPVLSGPGAFLWLWALPVLILLLLNGQGYRLIEGEMNDVQRGHAHWLGAAGLANLGIALGLWFFGRRRAMSSAWWGLPAVAVQTGYLWMALWLGDDALLPRAVTAWIYTPERYAYNQFAFAMLPLFWGMVRLACARPAKGRGLVFNLVVMVAAPTLLYAVFQVVFRVNHFWKAGPYLIAVLVILLGIFMFVALIRGVALGLRGVETWGAAGERVAIVVFALVLPTGGLVLNREIPFPDDFQAWEVYALTALNAGVLLLASWWHGRRPRLSLGLLCATLPFTLYFFVVFLPFLPLSIVAVIAMGAGFLVLAPTVLLVLHLSLLNKARRGSRGWRLATGIGCFLVLPGLFTARGLADRAALNAALDYVYAPSIRDGAITYGASRVNLRRALANHRSYKNGIYYPLLSDYYAWLVFDNLVLPDEKLARLEEVFFGQSGSAENHDPARKRGGFFGEGDSPRSSVRDRSRMPQRAAVPRNVAVETLAVSEAPAGDGASVVTLRLTLGNPDAAGAEYVKRLPLPAGVYACGFRMLVNGKMEPGRITEKKTALWVYSMIRDSERRDPGLLFYNAPGELELRVFPVVHGTPGVVEMDFLVPARRGAGGWGAGSNDPAEVLAEIGREVTPLVARLADGEAVAAGLGGAPGLAATELPVVKRGVYLQVIVDRSEANGFDGDLPAALAKLRARFPGAGTTRVTLANYETRELAAPEAGAGALAALPLRGGFMPDLALAQALREHRDVDLDGGAPGRAEVSAEGLPLRPVLVILSRKAMTPEKGLALEVTPAWRDLVPELEIYAADAGGGWAKLSGGGDGAKAEDAALLRRGNSVRPWVSGRAVRFGASAATGAMTGGKAAGELSYWSPNEKAWRPVEGVRVAEAEGTRWGRAVALQAKQQDHERSPGGEGAGTRAGGGGGLRELVKASRESGVMLASTSYIVVENSAQRRMLDVSERRKLDQNAALAFKEAPAPSWVWLAAGFGAWLAVREAWRRRGLRAAGG